VVLPKPLLEEQQHGFQVTFRKDIYTEEYLRSISLNDRQIHSVAYVKEHGQITNREYRDMAGLSDEVARLDLNDLVKKEVLLLKGKGRSSHYILR
jgi:ATP-dependent DNA helicase RecG